MTDSKHLHIAVSSDENYARFVASLMLSVIKNNRCFDKITFHLLSNGISRQSLDRLQSLTKENFNLRIYDISDLESRLGITVPQTIALTSYARLFMNRIIEKDIDKILYLDTDTIVIDQLDKLWNVNLGSNLVGGCLDIFDDDTTKTDVGLNPAEPYINAGVLLINLKQWRDENLDESFIEFLKIHDGKVHHHDQGIINGVCKGRVLLLPPRYNMHSTVFSHTYKLIKRMITPYYKEPLYKDALRNPAIIHFTEGFYNRPWKKNCKHPYCKAFMEYENLGPWQNTPLMRDNRSLAVKLLGFIFLNFPYPIYRCLSSVLCFVHKLNRK